jgi:hypothetical protein
VPGCGNLKSFSEPVDAIIYGRDLKAESESVMNEERFDKIRYYLRHLSYPQGADRSEKSRLRSAATHYKLIGGEDGVPEILMLRDKEVISDPNQQFEIAKQLHDQSHGGINKTTAAIATKYHWVRIKETVNQVIKLCQECKDSAKIGTSRSDSIKKSRPVSADENAPPPPEIEELPVEELRRKFNANDFIPAEQHILDDSLDSDHHDPAMYSEMDIDPQILEQLQAQIASGEFQHHNQDFPQSGLPQFIDTTQLQHDPNGFDVGGGTQQGQFVDTNMMTAPQIRHFQQSNGQIHPEQMNTALQNMDDQMMDDGSGLNNMQNMQHVLHMDNGDNDIETVMKKASGRFG